MTSFPEGIFVVYHRAMMLTCTLNDNTSNDDIESGC